MREENGKWRILHDGGLHILYSSPNTVRVIKSTILRLAGHVARMEEVRSAFKILKVNLQENVRMDLMEIDVRL